MASKPDKELKLELEGTPSISDTFSDYTPPDRTFKRDEKAILHASVSQEPKPWHVVALPSFSFAGVQLVWAVLIGHATAHLRKLGLSDKAVGLAWIAGPVTGTIVQPIAGTLSDRCNSRLGRRRPFMLWGTFVTCIGMIVFSQAGELGGLLGDPVSKRGGGSRTGLVIGILSFWVVDFGVNLLQTPTRALLADVVPTVQLPLGSSFFAVASGMGKAIGYALGAFTPGVKETFSAAALILVVLTLATVSMVQEKAVVEEVGMVRETFWELVTTSVGKSVKAIGKMPPGIIRVFAVQWLTYLGLMYLFIYGCDWVGQDVFGGSGDAPPGSEKHHLFEAGVRFGNAGFLGMALITMVFAPLIPTFCRLIGVRMVWSSSLLLMGVSFQIVSFVQPGRVAAAVVFGSASLTICCAFTLPWTIVSAILADGYREERGLHLATFNLSQATPGLLASVTGGILVHISGLDGVMRAVGTCALAAAGAAAFIEVPLIMSGNGCEISGRASRSEGEAGAEVDCCERRRARSPGRVGWADYETKKEVEGGGSGGSH